MRKITFYILTLFVAVIGLSNVTVSDNGRAGVTGAPGETTCNDSGCHGGTSTAGLVMLNSNIPATGYVPGATYNMSLTVTMAGKSLFGLGVEALTSTNANAGTLVITNSAETQIKSKTISGVSRKNVVHQDGGGLATGTKTFNFDWVAPAAGIGNVTFYYAGLACNNNGDEDSGDVCYFGNQVFSPESGTAAISATATATSVSCNGGADATATVTPTGGSNYTYAWTSGATTATATNLAAGTYTVTVTSGTASTTANVTVTQPSALSAATNSPGAITCTTSSENAAVTASGGTAPYSYLWSNNATTSSITVSAAGDYAVVITDSKGCTTSANISVTANTNVPDVTASASNQGVITCAQGSINLAASSTAPSVNYAWSGPNGFSSTEAQTTTNVIGNYQVIATNTSNGCTSQSDVVISQNILSTTLVQINNGTGANDAFITIDVVGGVAPYAFEWKNAGGTIVSTDEDPQALDAGIYSVNITDANGCVVSLSNMIIQSSGMVDLGYFNGRLFPNPANDALYFEYDATRAQIEQLQLLNSQGQLVWKSIHPNAANTIDISAYPTGCYLFRAISTTNQANIRVMIERK